METQARADVKAKDKPDVDISNGQFNKLTKENLNTVNNWLESLPEKTVEEIFDEYRKRMDSNWV